MTDQIKVHVLTCNDRKNLYMRFFDPISGKPQRRSTRTTNRREAERAAAKWEAELREGRYFSPNKTLWGDFRERYEDEKLSSLAEGTFRAGITAMNCLERVIHPKRLGSLTSTVMSRFQAELRKQGMKDVTIDVRLAHLQAALGWAVEVGMLLKVPDMHRPKRVKGRKLMRGRPITAEEFDRMIEAAPQVRPTDPGMWQRYLTGLWLSGLRLEESTILSWDDGEPFAVDLTGRHPRFRIYAEAEKGNKDRLLPMTPDFAEWLLQTPPDERQGPVFRLEGLHTGLPLSVQRVGCIVRKIGKAAGVVVDKAEGKYASAHDLRRAFGTRWARKVKPFTLQRLMRHGSVRTTEKYYVDIDADDIADELWADHNSRSIPRSTPPSADSVTGLDAARQEEQPLT